MASWRFRLQRIFAASSITTPFWWSFKASLSVLLTLFFDYLVSNEDHVSSTFIAVCSTSPAVLLGIKMSITTMSGVIFGALVSSPFLFSSVNIHISLPLAVFVTLLVSHTVTFIDPTAAVFSALFLQLVSYGTPLNTIATRIIAPAMGVAAAIIVNVIISAVGIVNIYEGKLSVQIYRFFEELPNVETRCALIFQLQSQIAVALSEVALRRKLAPQNGAALLRLSLQRANALLRLGMAVLDLGPSVREGVSNQLRSWYSEGSLTCPPGGLRCPGVEITDEQAAAVAALMERFIAVTCDTQPADGSDMGPTALPELGLEAEDQV
eukprot:gnl/Dysnectes_brevis/4335_a5774_553.p1 GENE.gnl/Dysnectes_brevis/4335_a5774_553~~gnl/Dysnectes_brevis/4335_a5774_553.p1  ORF type:complete len:323 (+),score=66.51 gnl/Dysnectes_brevis/4335_a5774_553:46-1014(+)